jgi:haloacetate dehalogenase
MQTLGHDRFAVVGHDRGGLYALRLALDFPENVTKAVFLDCLPVSEHLSRAGARFATAWWHWFFFAQPDVPERVINADPDAWYKGNPEVMGAENYAEFRRVTRDPDVVRGMLEDYRAGLTVDNDDELADRDSGRRLQQPVRVIWSLDDDLEELHGDPLAIWSDWASEVSGRGLPSGHHVAEQLPDDLAVELGTFLGSTARETSQRSDGG